MDLAHFIKKIILPSGFSAPRQLVHEDLVAHPLGRKDLSDDLAGVNSSIEIIRETRGGLWPPERLEEDFDLLDLAWHEREFNDGSSFAYVIYNTAGEYLGCFYLYGMGVRAELTEELSDYEVDASWWVTTTAYERGYYEKLYTALRQWLMEDFPFKKVHYSNKQVPQH